MSHLRVEHSQDEKPISKNNNVNQQIQLAKEKMIFIVGASRSGTTLMSSILNRHPDISISPETHYFDDLRPKLAIKKSSITLTDEERHRCEDYFLAVSQRPYGHHGDPEKSKLSRHDLRSLANSIGNDADAYFEAFCRLNTRYANKKIWGEKTPRHIFRISEILEKFPSGRIICMVRDPRAVIASYRDWKSQADLNFQLTQEQRNAMKDDLNRASLSYNIILLSMLWCGALEAAFSSRKEFGQERIYIQKYEDLASSPETSVQNITSWLGLNYSPEMLDVAMQNSSFSQFHLSRGVLNNAVDRWREKLSDEEIGIIQSCCGNKLTSIGYDHELVSTPYIAFFRELILLSLSARRIMMVNSNRIGNLPGYILNRLNLVYKSFFHT